MNLSTTETEPASAPNTRPQLWNPNAAACWSLLFTPVFGAVLHAANWRQLGQASKAQRSMLWVYGGLGVLLIALVLPQSVLNNVRHLPLMALLLAWYFLSAKQQVTFINEEGISYQKKAWAVPLVAGVLGLVVYSTAASALVSTPASSIKKILESESVELVTGLVQERLGSSTSCEKVSLEKEVSKGVYHGVAYLNDGVTVPIVVEFDGERMFVNLRSIADSPQSGPE